MDETTKKNYKTQNFTSVVYLRYSIYESTRNEIFNKTESVKTFSVLFSSWTKNFLFKNGMWEGAIVMLVVVRSEYFYDFYALSVFTTFTLLAGCYDCMKTCIFSISWWCHRWVWNWLFAEHKHCWTGCVIQFKWFNWGRS